ncbi:unnamed protein product [Medioppia subpectinata]|uniref:Peptidase S1 domain-containing protein n=1 Tax=Medioppia subpectinata TaxID=1979941 RepID=A0A7R9PWU7_9ACAR|nr:unnamed protein product [Medioppia subpectinata]CAG2104304.1 unnamed protein product [Medioppia subpectinata]
MQANNYTTDAYMSDIINQYQLSGPIMRAQTPHDVSATGGPTGGYSPYKTSLANARHDREQVTDYFAFAAEDNRKLNRQQMNASVDPFGSRQSPARPARPSTAIANTNYAINRIASNAVLTSDSFPTDGRNRAAQQWVQPRRRPRRAAPYRHFPDTDESRQAPYATPQSPRRRPAPYVGMTAQNRIVKPEYKATVIDYSGNGASNGNAYGTGRPATRAQPYQQFDSMDPQKSTVRQSIAELQSAIARLSQRAQAIPGPSAATFPSRPILKNTGPTAGPSHPPSIRQNIAAATNYLMSRNVDQATRATANRLLTAAKLRNMAARTLPSVPYPNHRLTTRPARPVLKRNENIMRRDLMWKNEFDKRSVPVSPRLLSKYEFHAIEVNPRGYYCHHCGEHLATVFAVGQHCTFNHIHHLKVSSDPLLYRRINLDNELPMKQSRPPAGQAPKFTAQGLRIVPKRSPKALRQAPKTDPLTFTVTDNYDSAEPIAGLHYINEYTGATGAKYECQLCRVFVHDMYQHVITFKHRIQLLKAVNPTETNLDSIREIPLSVREIRKRVTELQRQRGTGCANKINGQPSAHQLMRPPLTPINRPQNFTKRPADLIQAAHRQAMVRQIMARQAMARQSMVRQIRGRQATDRQTTGRQSSVEVIDIVDDDDVSPFFVRDGACDLSRKCSLTVSTEMDAAVADIVVKRLQKSIVNYYMNKIPQNMRNVLMDRVVNGYYKSNNISLLIAGVYWSGRTHGITIGWAYTSPLDRYPDLGRGHARIGDYPAINLPTCGYVNSSGHSAHSRIVDGQRADPGEYPFVASIHDISTPYQSYRCGAAIINSYWLITAAHCFVQLNLTTQRVYVGSVKQYDYLVRHMVNEIRIFNILDVALVKVTKPIEVVTDGQSYAVNSVCLPERSIANLVTEDALFAGFGFTDVDAMNRSYFLRQTRLSIESEVECYQRFHRRFDEICAVETQHMLCSGDSGSPLVQFDGQRAVIIGVLTWTQRVNTSHNCGPGVMYFTRVSMIMDWIEKQISPTNTTTSVPDMTTTNITNTTSQPNPHIITAVAPALPFPTAMVLVVTLILIIFM